MADYEWPDSLAPYRVGFYLQPHTGGTESPFSRQRKVYALSAPRWVANFSVRGGDRGVGLAGKGASMDGFLAKVGGVNRVLAYDWRRPDRTGDGGTLQEYIDSFAGLFFTFDQGETFTLGERFIVEGDVGVPLGLSAEIGETQVRVSGFWPLQTIFLAGDYIGGDGRPHIITDDVVADGSGEAVVEFRPPMSRAITRGQAYWTEVVGAFQIISDDAGANTSEVGGPEMHEVEMVEDLVSPAPIVAVTEEEPVIDPDPEPGEGLGQMNFSLAANSGLLVLLEDI